MTNGEFINKAKYVVAKHTNENILKPEQGLISDNEVFVVWYTKVLQNYKALLATPIKDDQHYYEVTYNGDKDDLYLDVYNKEENVCIKVNENE
ncbi:DUF6275 family protein [Limosilactobacillus reuteri]|uniref:DUF6275 family protein n=1 Tax=Limosilactobacillus reuteri TaxID=1598 RepID=UPI001E359731|nr:DUF6275 family protein [Limosilactobacillus reuteri]MCC4359106.1 DUF6275 family protein [Limosilactobacillus reuteri]MCC4361753.1 DUF6275 family protein [Limosilactobacillus reuteri]MCC4365410.1 DUF6275 family protein [Limosilactobacillus reuteri]